MTVARVTERGTHAIALDNLQGSLAKLTLLQSQIASGKQIQQPSDSPDGTVTALQYRSELRRIEQYKRNAQTGLDWLGSTDTALQKGLEGLSRARELAIQGQNGAVDASARDAMAKEVDAIRETMIGLANTSLGDRRLFAGASATPVAYDSDGVYQGTPPGVGGDQVNREVGPDAMVRINLTGPEAFGTPGADVFQALATLADNLRGNTAGLGTSLDEITVGQTLMRSALATTGARYNQIETMMDRNEAVRIDTTKGLAEVEDVDLTEATLNVKLQEVAFQAALNATAKVTRNSLLDFLR